VLGVGRVDLDLGAEPADVDVDEPAVTEVVVPQIRSRSCSRLNTRPDAEASSTRRRNSVFVRWISWLPLRTTPSSGMISSSPKRSRVRPGSVARARRRRARMRADSSFGWNGLVT
jgi:hypothetical protein